jgi:hypothetical protein
MGIPPFLDDELQKIFVLHLGRYRNKYLAQNQYVLDYDAYLTHSAYLAISNICIINAESKQDTA